MQLNGKTAVVTGGAKGIGKAIALRLAREKVNIAIVDKDEENAAKTKTELELYNIDADFYYVDLGEISQITSTYNKIYEDFESVEILVNAAGVMKVEKFLDVTPKSWDKVMDINAKSSYFSMQNVADHMIEKNNGGKIINISSITGKSSRPDYPVYAASKSAIISFTKSAAQALAKYKINVNAICPGYVHTDIWREMDKYYVENLDSSEGEVIRNILKSIPMDRAGDLDEVAALALFLCKEESNYITGQSINIDGGAVMH